MKSNHDNQSKRTNFRISFPRGDLERLESLQEEGGIQSKNFELLRSCTLGREKLRNNYFNHNDSVTVRRE